MPDAQDKEEELTEAGRPRVPRPMPDHSSATRCPHCGEEVGMGHYVCWNCSKDIRMGELTESQIVEEYRDMQAGQEIAFEMRNRRFFVVLVGALLGLGVLTQLVGWGLGTGGLFAVVALVPSWWALKATRRIARIRKARQAG